MRIAEVVLQQFREMPTGQGAASNPADATDSNYNQRPSLPRLIYLVRAQYSSFKYITA